MTGNEKIKKFIKVFSIRLFIFALLAFGCFFIDHGREYYLGLTEGSSYNKIPWIYRKINTSDIDSNSVLFFGPSLCLNGINDSLLTSRGKHKYFNMGINHSCYGLTYAILKDIVEKKKPRKVFLSLRYGFSMQIHNMYPIVVNAGEILASAKYTNVEMFNCIYTKTAWNIHYYTRFFKLPVDEAPPRQLAWGQDPEPAVDEEKVQGLYNRDYKSFESIFAYQKDDTEASTGFSIKSLKRNLYEKKLYYLDNVLYQQKMLMACKDLLAEKQIAYDFVLFPTLHQQIAGNTKVTVDYYEKKYPDIFNGHAIIFEESEQLKSFKIWTDALHLNKYGADIFTDLLLKDIE
ncbi:MAG TPA: hypothetical protein PL029_03260 [Bacteroidia bacterium]|nr:hypothetical protein [Bacteroidia bacterium]